MMRNFKLIIQYKNNIKRTITAYNNQSLELFHEPYSTFNEKLTESENDQFQLTFSIAGFINDHGQIRKNHWLDIIKLGSKLILEMDDQEFEVRFIVSKVSPAPSKENIIYNFTAEDEVSYMWSRRRLGYSYSNLDRGVENIYDIVDKVLLDNFLQGPWNCKDTEGELQNPENGLSNKKISLEVLDSNPYNVIIEACNTLGCYLKVNYKEQFLTFYQKNDINFSGYRYRPEVNLSQFLVNYDNNEFATIMHGVGGENAYGEIITLVPAIPSLLMQFLIDNANKWQTNKGEWYDDIWNNIYIKLPDNQADAETKTRIYDAIEKTNELWTYKYRNTVLFTELPVAENETTAQYAERRKSISFKGNNDEVLPGEEIEQFLTIAKNIPHLGQFLSDFEYFKKAKLLSEGNEKSDQDEICYQNLTHLFNQDMRNNNIYLKYYEPKRYELQWSVDSAIAYIENIATNFYGALLNVKFNDEDASYTITVSSPEDVEKYENDINLYVDNKIIFNNLDLIQGLKRVNFGDIVEIQTLQNKLKSYSTRIGELEAKYRAFMDTKFSCELSDITLKDQSYTEMLSWLTDLEDAEYNESDITLLRNLITPTRSEISNIKDKIITLAPLVGGNDINGKHINGSYDWLLSILENKYGTYPQKNAVNKDDSYNSTIEKYENANNELWRKIYNQYGNYIYEQKYENTDELDSYSLYNQTITYFEKQKKPVASYSIEVLDIGILELIDLPRLTIGSKIRVYNDKLNLVDYQNGTRGEDIISFNNNDLIVTQITTDLRNPTKIQISVEQVQPYSAIVSKLLQSVRL